MSMESRVFELEKEIRSIPGQLENLKDEIKLEVIAELDKLKFLLNCDRCPFCLVPAPAPQDIPESNSNQVNQIDPSVVKVGGETVGGGFKVGLIDKRRKREDVTEEKSNYRSLTTIASLQKDKILQKIFKKLDTKSLKTTRLVCKSWNKDATSILSDCSVINVGRFFNLSASSKVEKFPIFPRQSTPWLITNITTRFEKAFSKKDQWKPLTAFCEEYGIKVLDIKADDIWDFEDEIPLCKILKRFCPKLERLQLRHCTKNDVENSFKFIPNIEFREPLNLKVIEVQTFHHHDRFQFILNEIVKASINLEHLKIDGQNYPDLSKNTKLKKLEIIGKSHPIYHAEDPKRNLPYFTFHKLSKMITQVSSSLEILILKPPINHPRGHDWSFISHQHCLTFESIMPKLTMLINECIFLFPMESMLPCNNLQTLKLVGQSTDSSKMKEFFEGSMNPLLNLTNLSIGEIEDEKLLKRIIRVFPNLMNFEFSIGQCINYEEDEIQSMLKNIIEVLSIPKLVVLKITIKCQHKLMDLVNALFDNPTFFKELKKLTIINDDSLGLGFDNYISPQQLKKFGKALLLTSSLELVEFVDFDMLTDDLFWITKYVAMNCLPIRFIRKQHGHISSSGSLVHEVS